jgi:hypothetical protein
MDESAQPFERRSPDVLEDAAQQFAGLPPLVALQPEQDRRLVREILIQRSNADAGFSATRAVVKRCAPSFAKT